MYHGVLFKVMLKLLGAFLGNGALTVLFGDSLGQLLLILLVTELRS